MQDGYVFLDSIRGPVRCYCGLAICIWSHAFPSKALAIDKRNLSARSYRPASLLSPKLHRDLNIET